MFAGTKWGPRVRDALRWVRTCLAWYAWPSATFAESMYPTRHLLCTMSHVEIKFSSLLNTPCPFLTYCHWVQASLYLGCTSLPLSLVNLHSRLRFSAACIFSEAAACHWIPNSVLPLSSLINRFKFHRDRLKWNTCILVASLLVITLF